MLIRQSFMNYKSRISVVTMKLIKNYKWNINALCEAVCEKTCYFKLMVVWKQVLSKEKQQLWAQKVNRFLYEEDNERRSERMTPGAQ